MRITVLVLMFILSLSAKAQVDTINTSNLKLNISALKEDKASYAVFFEDSLGKRLSSADIWDRKISISTNASGQKIYKFEWDWYKRDSLQSHIEATGLLPSLTPLSHYADYKTRGKFYYTFDNNIVTV